MAGCSPTHVNLVWSTGPRRSAHALPSQSCPSNGSDDERQAGRNACDLWSRRRGPFRALKTHAGPLWPPPSRRGTRARGTREVRRRRIRDRGLRSRRASPAATAPGSRPQPKTSSAERNSEDVKWYCPRAGNSTIKSLARVAFNAHIAQLAYRISSFYEIKMCVRGPYPTC